MPRTHPLRGIEALGDEVVRELSPPFEATYARIGRPSVPPERLLKALLQIALFGWLETVGGLRKSRFRGLLRNQMAAYLAGAA